MKLYGIKTNKGYYFTDKRESSYYNGIFSVAHLVNYKVNGVSLEETFKTGWVFSKEFPKLLENKVFQPDTNRRYELKDKNLSKTFKEVYSYKEAVKCMDGYEHVYFPEFKDIQSLYEYKTDKREPVWTPIEFEFEIIGEVEEILFSTKKNLQNKNIIHDKIDEVIYPGILLNNGKCSLSSKDTYGIIRRYVQDNINPKIARISSDYDFCFKVEKKVPLSTPYTRKVERKQGRKKFFDSLSVEYRDIECFEMTYAGYANGNMGYQGYTRIEPFIGDNIVELEQNISKYLEDLIKFINEPLKECGHCNGKGLLLNEEVDKPIL